ncbi:TPA: phage antirepressor KilAC domain-containing protein [Clostridioides difficile]|uniref:phage antirepressor n=2 Tax=Clostridioides difficile TaxID=1496 RepID=UPI0012CB56CC|nr:phage antirepressor KilAC domain-containing protein [Clostridioides difficile]ELX4533937.1 phage antirepressor KilAC domain-containing protein [Clostridioides difficile]KAK2258052.1 antirepressor [Clostridioides difficile]MBH7088570.1 phage antirepressor KilAC domain-containing protein [Clostridioides difficile]MBY2853390.1 phage antirepressor KilAC domain-containing protein [Clostridioides difficile]MBZ4448258.1 phage antirepressor KilAC domain-containing protein [Clostridioides difficile]
MNNLQIFEKLEFGQIRMVEVDKKPYFVATDIAKCLGYANTSKAINDHCRWVTKSYIPHPQNENKILEVNTIPESDMYRLIVNSKLPNAEKFESWVFDEVLPTIRKTGGYIHTTEDMTDDEIMARALQVAQKTIEKKSREIEEKDKVIQLQQPKVLFADSVASSDNSILVGELAKLLRQNGIDTGQNRLFDWLRNNGYLIKRKGEDYNTPTQKSVDLGVIEIKEGTRVHPDGHTSITKTPKITGKGQIYFINKFKKNNQLSMLS